MLKIIKECFTWWHNQTVGTRFFTLLNGKFVAQDTLGNRYYTTRDGRKRWVIYAGLVEPTRLPTPWHAWLHRLVDEPPHGDKGDKGAFKRCAFHKSRVPNLTGTRFAYHPYGSLHHKAGVSHKSPSASYTPWCPSPREEKEEEI